MEGNLSWGIVEEGWRKGPWTSEEDKLLIEYVRVHGEGKWNSVASSAGLKRNGKSCRLRWVNYLRPDLKRGRITPHEEDIILELHARWGNRWSTIARSLPGRTDNEIKNYWRTHFKKKGENSPESSEKSKKRQLRRQQFQQQQHQQHNQIDMKRIMSLLDDNDYKVPCYPYNCEDQYVISSLMDDGYMSEPDWTTEGIMLSGLWNLDDIDQRGCQVSKSSS